MVSGLAFYLAQKFNPQLVQQMKLYYEDELARALSEDGSSTSVHITPKSLLPRIHNGNEENTQKQYQIDQEWSFHIMKWLENGMVL